MAERRKKLAALGVAALTLLGPVALDTGVADATTEATTESTVTARGMSARQKQVFDQVNRARTARGKRAIAPNGLMNVRAQKWAEHLAACQCLQHRRPPYGVPAGWYAAAENVGRSGDGGSLHGVHMAFMRSPGHRRNVLNSRWTALGVGVAGDRAGEWFVVHVFADYSR